MPLAEENSSILLHISWNTEILPIPAFSVNDVLFTGLTATGSTTRSSLCESFLNPVCNPTKQQRHLSNAKAKLSNAMRIMPGMVIPGEICRKSGAWQPASSLHNSIRVGEYLKLSSSNWLIIRGVYLPEFEGKDELRGAPSIGTSQLPVPHTTKCQPLLWGAKLQ